MTRPTNPTYTTVPACWRTVIVHTLVVRRTSPLSIEHRDLREELWRAPWPAVETALVNGYPYVALLHEGARWTSVLGSGTNGAVCLGKSAIGRVLDGEIGVAEGFFSTSWRFVRDTEGYGDATRDSIAELFDRTRRWREGDVSCALGLPVHGFPEESKR